jgi:hypothetical protein
MDRLLEYGLILWKVDGLLAILVGFVYESETGEDMGLARYFCKIEQYLVRLSTCSSLNRVIGVR